MRNPFTDTTTLVFAVLAAASGIACFWLEGQGAVEAALSNFGSLILYVLPQIAAGLLIGGLAQQLIDRDRAARLFGERSGMRGLVLATLSGMLTPGGPFTSFPLVYALWKAGADIGVLIAYLMSWAVIGIHRMVVWELPFMGVEFSLLRFAVSLPMPILAGIAARVIVTRTGWSLKGDAP